MFAAYFKNIEQSKSWQTPHFEVHFQEFLLWILMKRLPDWLMKKLPVKQTKGLCLKMQAQGQLDL